MRSASDRSPRGCATKPHQHHHQPHRSADHDEDDRPAAASVAVQSVTQWRAGGERATLPRAARDAERTAVAAPGDVWRPMTDLERARQKDGVVVKGFIS